MALASPVQPVPSQRRVGTDLVPIDVCDEALYASDEPYPASWGWYTVGAGLNEAGDRVVFLAVHCTPVRVVPSTSALHYVETIDVTVSYSSVPAPPAPAAAETALLIITPQSYSDILAPLKAHKDATGLPARIVTLETIASTYQGRDLTEQIKYCILEAVETQNTSFVLLVGDMKTLPIRFTYASWWEDNLLSDLYYADLYNAAYEFCTWDGNANGRFGETDHDGNDLDGVDLYPDVHVGRLAAVTAEEVTTVVQKIITYETETFGQEWFRQAVLCGGDTFPPALGAVPFVYEGEITNVEVAEHLGAFAVQYLWTSKRSLHPSTFNMAVNRGVGLLSYSGHGFEHGWGTYRANAPSNHAIHYYTPYLAGLSNGGKLPIVFFDACLTAKLDFNITDLWQYYPSFMSLVVMLTKLPNDPSVFYPSFAWCMVRRPNGGAIATIGSTRTAYTHVNSQGVHGGAGYLNVAFFSHYEDGVRVGEMLSGAQIDYLNGVGLDYFTLEEFLLLGDPSLRVGGIPAP
jgi:hypothetical protein